MRVEQRGKKMRAERREGRPSLFERSWEKAPLEFKVSGGPSTPGVGGP